MAPLRSQGLVFVGKNHNCIYVGVMGRALGHPQRGPFFCDVYVYIAFNALAVTSNLGCSEAFLRFCSLSGIVWSLGILLSSILEAFLGAFLESAPFLLFSMKFIFRLFSNMGLFDSDIIALKYVAIFFQGFVFVTTLVRGIWAMSFLSRRSTAAYAAILPICIVIGVYLPHIIISTVGPETPIPSILFTVTMVLSCYHLAGALYNCAIISSHPTLSDMVNMQSPSASSEAWVFALVATIPVASFLVVKFNVDMVNPVLWSMALCYVAVDIFLWVPGNFCWVHLALWLVLCSTLLFCLDAVREVEKMLAHKSNLGQGSHLVVALACLSTAVALGCLADSGITVLFNTLLPGIGFARFKINTVVLLSVLTFIPLATFTLRSIFRRHKL